MCIYISLYLYLYFICTFLGHWLLTFTNTRLSKIKNMVDGNNCHKRVAWGCGIPGRWGRCHGLHGGDEDQWRLEAEELEGSIFWEALGFACPAGPWGKKGPVTRGLLPAWGCQCCVFWNPGRESDFENHKTLHEKTRCAQELSTPLETAMCISFCGSRDWSTQNNLEREWPSPTGRKSPPARGFCKGAFFFFQLDLKAWNSNFIVTWGNGIRSPNVLLHYM